MATSAMCVAARPEALEKSSEVLAVKQAKRLEALAVRPLELDIVLAANSEEGGIAGLRMVDAVKETRLRGMGEFPRPVVAVGGRAQRLNEFGELSVSERVSEVVDD